MTEAEFIEALRQLPLHPGARELRDDAAALDVSGRLVVTKDMIVEGVHYLPSDPPADIGWKLVAVNLSDLAAKAARPLGALLGYPLAGDSGWDRGFLAGLAEALRAFDCPLVGGDTVALPPGAPRTLSLTLLGTSERPPGRRGARVGDLLWVTGTIGDAGAGLSIARGKAGPAELLARYRRPAPRLAEGMRLGPDARAMMDVSDGLLLDAGRMAEASGCGLSIDLDAVPLSDACRAFAGEGVEARLAAATAGDDYELLFALAPGRAPPVPATRIGRLEKEPGLRLFHGGAPLARPGRLGFEHGG